MTITHQIDQNFVSPARAAGGRAPAGLDVSKAERMQVTGIVLVGILLSRVSITELQEQAIEAKAGWRRYCCQCHPQTTAGAHLEPPGSSRVVYGAAPARA